MQRLAEIDVGFSFQFQDRHVGPTGYGFYVKTSSTQYVKSLGQHCRPNPDGPVHQIGQLSIGGDTPVVNISKQEISNPSDENGNFAYLGDIKIGTIFWFRSTTNGDGSFKKESHTHFISCDGNGVVKDGRMSHPISGLNAKGGAWVILHYKFEDQLVHKHQC